ncbi:site-2 protease family protein [Sphingomonas caeni]|uniref:site-2 protease family protein n=1 Tax=Sphingomonas caeni TaxID=2984949 RepID=UPI00222F7551|nr:site-2 protease family protein [Sphingomonas caeni]
MPLVIAIVFHEVAHGLVANMLGDPTAAERGRLSFNPIKHVDPVGTIGLPLVLAVSGAPIFGWAKPVPVDFARLRNPRVDMVLVALAGPLMNVFLGALAAAAIGLLASVTGDAAFTGMTRFLAENLFNFLMINIFLAVFNLIPLPPFDGGHVVAGLMPRSLLPAYAQVARFGIPIMFLVVLVLPMISPRLSIVQNVVAPIATGIVKLFLGSALPGV